MSVHEKDDNLHVSDLGGGFNIFYFQPYLGKIPILTNIFQMAWNHQLEIHWNENDLKLSSTVTFRHHNDGFVRNLAPVSPPHVLVGISLVISNVLRKFMIHPTLGVSENILPDDRLWAAALLCCGCLGHIYTPEV